MPVLCEGVVLGRRVRMPVMVTASAMSISITSSAVATSAMAVANVDTEIEAAPTLSYDVKPLPMASPYQLPVVHRIAWSGPVCMRMVSEVA